MLTHRLRGFVLVTVFVFALAPLSPAWAQFRADHIPGFLGLQAGTQPPPGIYAGYVLFLYPTDTVKDGRGDSIDLGGADLTMAFHGASVTWVTPYTFAGGHVGGAAIFPFLKNRIGLNDLNVNSGLGYSDTVLTPISVGWHRTQTDFLAGYNLYLPTGDFEFGSPGNHGLGMIGQELSFGVTSFLDTTKQWHAAGNLAWEWHTEKKDTDIRVGQVITVEGGLGRSFYTKVNNPLPFITTVGMVGYGQFKVTEDSGSDIPLFLQGVGKDRVFGLGGEVSVFIPQARLTLLGRVIPEYGAQLHTQGITFVFMAGYELKSLARLTP